MQLPFFSIVIPTFNRSELFPYAVQSILKQTFEDFEIIICDNCSADETSQVARQFTDPRVKYTQTPRHFVIADNWEYARSHATGKLIMMLSDDDALVSTALERFADEATRHGADFLFSRVAEYRDQSYPGPGKNSVDCPAFSGSSHLVSADEFVRPLFSFRPKFNMHPSAFVFAKTIADFVRSRTGRFFWTNGVEYSAWPITTIFAKNIIYIDAPLTILGRTGKSWGSNIALCNPGKERIQAFIKDVDHERKHAPLNNFTMCNLMAEGMLTAKRLFPQELAAYEFDELNYLRQTMVELRKRQALGVDVSTEIAETVQYAAKFPSLIMEFSIAEPAAQPEETDLLLRRIRLAVGEHGGRRVRQRIQAYRLAQRLERGAVDSGFRAFGEDFGFSDILECAQFLAANLSMLHKNAVDAGGSYASPDTGSERYELSHHSRRRL
jgi:glycosyltransferase involved in cell wall biosynthesis